MQDKSKVIVETILFLQKIQVPDSDIASRTYCTKANSTPFKRIKELPVLGGKSVLAKTR
jgi:hypothetical protein